MSSTQYSFDPESIDFYDYTRADWFLVSYREGARSVAGPYIDFGGVNDYILTMTTPILPGRSFAGVAGADLRVDELERRLYHAAAGCRRTSRSSTTPTGSSGRPLRGSSPARC